MCLHVLSCRKSNKIQTSDYDPETERVRELISNWVLTLFKIEIKELGKDKTLWMYVSCKEWEWPKGHKAAKRLQTDLRQTAESLQKACRKIAKKTTKWLPKDCQRTAKRLQKDYKLSLWTGDVFSLFSRFKQDSLRVSSVLTKVICWSITPRLLLIAHMSVNGRKNGRKKWTRNS